MIDLLSLLLGFFLGFLINFLLTLFILGWMGGNLDRLEVQARALDETTSNQGR